MEIKGGKVLMYEMFFNSHAFLREHESIEL